MEESATETRGLRCSRDSLDPNAPQTPSFRRSRLATNQALITPLVEPVLERLDRHEELLTELRRTLKIQFKRIADMQAHLDEITRRCLRTQGGSAERRRRDSDSWRPMTSGTRATNRRELRFVELVERKG